jgi:flagellin-like protein
MMRKGITPIIAIIILLLITIALAGAAWAFLSGVLVSQTQKSFYIQPGGAYCTYDSSNGTYFITVRVVNIGTATLETSDFIVRSIDDVDPITLNTITIEPRDAGVILNSTNTTLGISGPGSHTLRLGTVASLQTIPIVC